ncbi:transcriptional regulator, TetR family [Aeromicrobium marinum DSM 15272]|uniref:Transcriptional regulator, TetR family n=1 Tax=Aeromicrobium marinum DSM 15272 TaxID=585531 RepID=E2SAW7_9ACTN|nr:TetR/AcrR family transcriptional regulator [Aeromicrobium marinum]EFQ83513.1 transcriptional regulator, TetR family [Aeromicrobium marinum DSM 15272]
MTTRRREATRDRLLEAARALLAETGIQGATVEMLCERAGFTRGAFYSNYESKDELILDLFDREKNAMLQMVQDAMESELTAEDDIGSIMRAADHFLAAYPKDRTSFLVHQEFVTHGIRGRQIAEVYRELWTETRRDFTELLERGLGLLDRRLIVPIDQAAVVLIGAWEMTMRDAFLETDADEADLALLAEMIPALLTAFLEPA